MDISKTLEILKKLGLPAELLDRLKAAANNIPADMLPNTLDMNAPESIQKYVSLNLFLNNALSDNGLPYQFPEFSDYFLDKPKGPSGDAEHTTAGGGGGGGGDESTDWQKKLWEDLPWKNK